MTAMRKAGGIALLTLASRVLGLVRDMLIAGLLGAGMAADAFVVAFKLPNAFRRLMADGAVAASIVPVLAPLDTEARRETAASAVLLSGLGLLALTGILMLFSGPLVTVLTGGFPDRPETFALARAYTFAATPYLVFAGLTALLGGILNATHRFSAAAAAPILLNLALLAAIFIPGGSRGLNLALAIPAGGALQLAFVFIAARRAGLTGPLKFIRPPKDVKKFFALLAPSLLTAGLGQIVLLADLMIAARLLPPGSLSVLFYADRLYTLPAGLAGIAIGAALLPKLSETLAAGKDGREPLIQAIEFAFLLTLPAAAGLFLLALPAVTLIYGHGAFGGAAILDTAATLKAYTAAIPLIVLNRMLTTACHAGRDMKTPLRVSAVLIAVNIGLDIVLARWIGVAGIALATSAVALLGAVALGAAVFRKGHLRPGRAAWLRLAKIVAATLFMTAAVMALSAHVHNVLILAAAGAAIYLAALSLLRVYGYKELRTLLAGP